MRAFNRTRNEARGGAAPCDGGGRRAHAIPRALGHGARRGFRALRRRSPPWLSFGTATMRRLMVLAGGGGAPAVASGSRGEMHQLHRAKRLDRESLRGLPRGAGHRDGDGPGGSLPCRTSARNRSSPATSPTRPGMLTRWIEHPQKLLPGNAMPEMGLSHERSVDRSSTTSTRWNSAHENRRLDPELRSHRRCSPDDVRHRCRKTRFSSARISAMRSPRRRRRPDTRHRASRMRPPDDGQWTMPSEELRLYPLFRAEGDHHRAT